MSLSLKRGGAFHIVGSILVGPPLAGWLGPAKWGSGAMLYGIAGRRVCKIKLTARAESVTGQRLRTTDPGDPPERRSSAEVRGLKTAVSGLLASSFNHDTMHLRHDYTVRQKRNEWRSPTEVPPG